MFTAAAASVLGEKLLVDTYPDGRVYCWFEILAAVDPKRNKVKVSKDGKKIYVLIPTSSFTANKLIKPTEQTGNNLHYMILQKAIEKAFDDNIAYLEEIAKDIDIPSGYTPELLFHLDYEINRYFVDAHGNKTKHVYCSSTPICFWVKKSNARSCPVMVQETIGAIDTMQIDTKEKATELNEVTSKLQAELKCSQVEAMMKEKKVIELEERLCQLKVQLQAVNHEKADIQTKEGARLHELNKRNLRLEEKAGAMVKVIEELKQSVSKLRAQCKEQEEMLENLEQEKDMIQVDTNERTIELNELINKLEVESKQSQNEAMMMEKKVNGLEEELLQLKGKLQATNHEKEVLMVEGGNHLNKLNERNRWLEQQAEEKVKLIEGFKLSVKMLEAHKQEQVEIMNGIHQEKEKLQDEAKIRESRTQKQTLRAYALAKKTVNRQKKIQEAAEARLQAATNENNKLCEINNVTLEEQAKARVIIEKEEKDRNLLSKFGKRHRSERPIEPERERVMDKITPKYWANYHPSSNGNAPVPDGAPSSSEVAQPPATVHSSSSIVPVPDGAPSSAEVAQPPGTVQSNSSMHLN